MVSLDQSKTNSEKNYAHFMSMMQVVGNPEGWGGPWVWGLMRSMIILSLCSCPFGLAIIIIRPVTIMASLTHFYLTSAPHHLLPSWALFSTLTSPGYLIYHTLCNSLA